MDNIDDLFSVFDEESAPRRPVIGANRVEPKPQSRYGWLFSIIYIPPVFAAYDSK